VFDEEARESVKLKGLGLARVVQAQKARLPALSTRGFDFTTVIV